jgi:hypothetical protein
VTWDVYELFKIGETGKRPIAALLYCLASLMAIRLWQRSTCFRYFHTHQR